jgi:hypothetical protein
VRINKLAKAKAKAKSDEKGGGWEGTALKSTEAQAQARRAGQGLGTPWYTRAGGRAAGAGPKSSNSSTSDD